MNKESLETLRLKWLDRAYFLERISKEGGYCTNIKQGYLTEAYAVEAKIILEFCNDLHYELTAETQKAQ